MVYALTKVIKDEKKREFCKRFQNKNIDAESRGLDIAITLCNDCVSCFTYARKCFSWMRSLINWYCQHISKYLQMV